MQRFWCIESAGEPPSCDAVHRDEAQLIREVQVHAREAHALPLSDEQVRAMMFIDQDGETATAPQDA